MREMELPQKETQFYREISNEREANVDFSSINFTPSSDEQSVSFQVLPLFSEQPEQIAHKEERENRVENKEYEIPEGVHFRHVENAEIRGHGSIAFVGNESLLGNRETFNRMLQEFHASQQTCLTVPKIGGWDLDLFAFYNIVTSCGGLQQVIKDRRWSEVARDLKVPSSITNVSFFLRKHYVDLLYDFEQLYYFKAYGQQSYPIGILPAPLPVQKSKDEPDLETPADATISTKKRKKKRNLIQSFGDPGASVGHCVTGAIKSKFDSGYLVTVVVGSEKLSGVLYHVSAENIAPQFASVPGLLNTIGSKFNGSGLEIQVSKKKRESTTKKDPNAPRQSRSGYNYFYMEQCAKFKENHPDLDRETSKVVADMWNNLSEQERQPYYERSQVDKQRYRREMEEYRKRKSSMANDDHVKHGITDGVLKENEGLDVNNIFQDGRDDYHVSLETDMDMTTFQGTQHQEAGVSSIDLQMYSNQDGGHIYPTLLPENAEGSEYHVTNSGSLSQEYQALTDNYSYQTGSVPPDGSQGTLPFPVTVEQVQWGSQGEHPFDIQDPHI